MKSRFWISAIAAVLCGCESSAPGDVDKYVEFNIVTYEGTTAGNATVLSYQAVDDSPLITLTCDWRPNRELAAGTRLLVAYTTDTPAESGHVNLTQAVLIYGGQPEWADNAVDGQGDPIWLNSMWRSGHYINLDCLGRYASGKRRMELVIDRSTIGSDYPVLHLTHRIDGDQMAPYDQRLYGSWDVDAIWSRPDAKGIRIMLDDANRGIKELTFSKNQ